MKPGITIRNENGDEAAAIFSIKRSGDKLIMDGMALGAMRMDMILDAEDALRAMKMMCSWEVVAFVLLLPIYAIRNRMKGSGKDQVD